MNGVPPPRAPEEYDIESLIKDPGVKEAQAVARQLDELIAGMAVKTRGAYTRVVGSLHLAFAITGDEKFTHGVIKLGLLPDPPNVPQSEVQKTFYKLAIQSLQEDLRDLEAKDPKPKDAEP